MQPLSAAAAAAGGESASRNRTRVWKTRRALACTRAASMSRTPTARDRVCESFICRHIQLPPCSGRRRAVVKSPARSGFWVPARSSRRTRKNRVAESWELGPCRVSPLCALKHFELGHYVIVIIRLLKSLHHRQSIRVAYSDHHFARKRNVFYSSIIMNITLWTELLHDLVCNLDSF